jgi:hypothetical protein
MQQGEKDMSQQSNESPKFVDPFPDKDMLSSQEAAIYVAAVWGFETYSEGAFRSLVFRKNYDPDFGNHASAYYRKERLKQWPKPDKKNPRGPRAKRTKRGIKQDEEGENNQLSSEVDPSVIFKRSPACYHRELAVV